MSEQGPFVSEAANVAAAQWEWVATALHESIANLGYPVGMGLSPHPNAAERAAKIICEYVACQIDAQVDRSPEGQDGATRLDRNDESAVGEAETPGSSSNHSIEIEE